MALKPTIYKFRIALSDLDRNYYDQLDLTVAMHPSETVERMIVRVLAFCFNAQERLAFSTGLSNPELPDIFVKSRDDQTELWIDVGEPSAERAKKASHSSPHVKIYCFNSKSDVWWDKERKKLARLNIEVIQFDWSEIRTLSDNIQRTMDFSVSIADARAFISMENTQLDIGWLVLQEST